MIVKHTDFNGADGVISAQYNTEWRELCSALKKMPLHLKASDQAGRQGASIFDPVGTNEFINAELSNAGWRKLAIPTEFDFLGIDIDYGKNGLIAEAQFSNCPFLLNNTVRSELFYKAKTRLEGDATKVVVIITKARMFPASNSTLYYEQAVHQLSSLAKYKVFDVPMRCVGLFTEEEGTVEAVWTTYTASRYSRTVRSRSVRKFNVSCRRQGGRFSFTPV
jgi:hypothetical protein